MKQDIRDVLWHGGIRWWASNSISTFRTNWVTTDLSSSCTTELS